MQFHSNNYNCGSAKEIVFLESSFKEVSLEWYHRKILSTLWSIILAQHVLGVKSQITILIKYG